MGVDTSLQSWEVELRSRKVIGTFLLRELVDACDDDGVVVFEPISRYQSLLRWICVELAFDSSVICVIRHTWFSACWCGTVHFGRLATVNPLEVRE